MSKAIPTHLVFDRIWSAIDADHKEVWVHNTGLEVIHYCLWNNIHFVKASTDRLKPKTIKAARRKYEVTIGFEGLLGMVEKLE